MSGTASGAVIMGDPGNFTPYYIDSLCRGLADLGVPTRVVASPPLFEPVDPEGRYAIDRRLRSAVSCERSTARITTSTTISQRR